MQKANYQNMFFFKVHNMHYLISIDYYFVKLLLNYIFMRKRLNSQTKSLTNDDKYFSGFKSKRQYTKTNRSLSTSTLTVKNNGIKLPQSFYNDEKPIYLSKSQVLSEKKSAYQVKPITYSQRRKYQSMAAQSIVNRRNTASSQLLQPQTYRSKQAAKKKIQNLTIKRYNQLVYGSKEKLIRQKFLEKSITEDLQQKNKSVKWINPYSQSYSIKSVYEGKPLVPKKIQSFKLNRNSSELKVLNLDRLFRKKQGKLTNVVPLPVVKMQAVTSRSNVMKIIKKKDKIHDVIQDYNQLLKIMKLNKTAPRIGVKGKSFTLAPTLQQLMGIKIKPMKKQYFNQGQQISDQIFIQNCWGYLSCIKKDAHLTKRLIAGIKNAGKLDLSALSTFYSIFINKVAKLEEKINFLSYFFIPAGQEKIEVNMLKLILQLMCEKLPSIENLNVKTDLLSEQQKSKIFLQALHRVLFGQVKEMQGLTSFNRDMIQIILQRNQDAVDLLVKLLQID